MKVCSKCQIPQPLENFSNNKSKKDGKRPKCKLCDKQYREENKDKFTTQKKQYRKENREQILLRQKQRYESNKEDCSLKEKRYREENKEKIALKNKKWRDKNKEKIAVRMKQWYHNNKDCTINKVKQYRQTPTGKAVIKNIRHKRRTVTKQGDVTTIQLKELLENSDHCFYCNDPLILNEVHIDHYISLSKGGLHTISNLRVACKKCNLSKLNKSPEEFTKILHKE